jgi:hypothetical protein
VNGIAICWPDGSRRIRTLAETRRIPLHCYPRQATIPGSRLALTAPDGTIQLLCEIVAVSERKTVRTATGDHLLGYELIAKRGTVRTNLRRTLGEIRFRWRLIGQLRYFDQRSFRPISITGERQVDGPVLSGHAEADDSLRFREFDGAIPGLKLNDPEAQLVRRYTKWIDSTQHFVQSQRVVDGGWTDLFNTTRWTLFEAKSHSDDRTVREAFGQLFDYRRGFARSPRLAMLLPERPRKRMLAFLNHHDVAIVWERSNGTFVDSVDQRLTRELRSEYRQRAR